MDQQPIIIVKNVSGSSQGFLGSVIQPGSESKISDLYFQNEITGSSELRALINSGDIVINNGADVPIGVCDSFVLNNDIASWPPAALGYPGSLSIGDNYMIAGDTTYFNNQGQVLLYYKNEPPNYQNPYVTWTNPWDWGGDGAMIQASDGGSNDQFGYSVEISNGVSIIGAINAGSAGQAYILTNNDTPAGVSWDEQILGATGPISANSKFGWSVSIDGNYAIIGAPFDATDGTVSQGAAFIFKNVSGTWTQVARLAGVLHPPTPNAAAVAQKFGWSVSISGNYAIVGSTPLSGSNETSANLYKNDGNDNWNHEKTLLPDTPDIYQMFGFGVSIDSDCVTVGCQGYPGTGATLEGAVFLYRKDQGGSDNWGEEKKIMALPPGTGAQNDGYGSQVSLSGGYVIVGAPNKDLNGNSSGGVYIYSKDCGGALNWGQINEEDGASAADYFGSSVSIRGNYVAIGAAGQFKDPTNLGSIDIYTVDTGPPAGDLTPPQAITLCAYPYSMLNATTSGTDNASVGTSTLENLTSGDCNTAVGDYSLSALTGGSDNIAIGVQAGINYTGTESDNILVGHPGATGEIGTLRIGTGIQTRAYISGIHGVTPSGNISPQDVFIDNNGQLGSAVSFPRLIDSYVDTTLTTTTSASLRTRMNATIPILLAGDYSLNISYCWNHNGQQGTRTDFISVITFDGAILGNSPANSLPDTHRQEPKDADGSGGPTGTNQQYSWSKTFILENVTTGSKSLTLQYRSSNAGTTSSIWNIVYILNRIQ